MKGGTEKKIALFSRDVAMALLAIAAIVLIVYSSSFGNQFTNWDDDVYITDNISIRELNAENIKEIFKTITTKVYAPLTVFSFAIEYHFYGLDPFFYIFDNILIHIAVSWLIYIFALQLGLKGPAAFMAALLFGIHPMHVESVAWITERKDTLYSFFYMLSVVTYWRFLDTKKWYIVVVSVVSALLSILAKPMALSLPLVLFVCDWVRGREFFVYRKLNWRIFLEKIPYFAVIIPVTAVTYLANARNPIQDFGEAILIWIWSFSFYIYKFIFPFNLSPIYEFPEPVSFAHVEYNIAVIVFMITVYLIFHFRKNRLFIFAIAYYFFSIFFMLRMDEELHVSVVADRFMYLPSAGICVYLGYHFSELLKSKEKKSLLYKRITMTILVVLFASLGVKTYQQCKVWKDSATLWDVVLQETPETALAYNNRGQIYMDNGEIEKAIWHFEKALSIYSKQNDALYNLGLIYQDHKNDYEKALEYYDKAIAAESDYAKAYHNKCFIYIETERYEPAFENCNRMLELKPKDGGVYFNLSLIYYRHFKDYEKALENALKARELGHEFTDKYLTLLRRKIAEQK